jgi:type I restriction enzyme, S subunit
MSDSWPRMKLADCVELLSGFAFKSQYFTDKPEDIALVKGENVSQGHVLWDISKRWAASQWDELEKFQLRAGDVVIAMDRPWVPAGLKWCFIREGDPKAFLVQRCCRLRANPKLVDQSFLRVVIGGQIFEGYIKPITTGVNVPHISGRQILDFEFEVPPLPVQRRIAGILSAYDELIENSQRRIRLLEDMARALYREWFVHFRFPGHASLPRLPSVLGDIPQGWEIKSIQQFGAVITGKTPSKANADFYGNDVPFVKTPDMHGNMFILGTSDCLSAAGAESQANKTLPAGSICVSCIGTIGVVSITTEDCQTNQQINSVILANPVSREFLFLRLQDSKQTLENLGANGATMGNVNKGKFEALEIVCPSDDLLARYHRLVEPMFSEILSLFRQIQNLRRTRDLLLPRLLSGQVALAEAAN